PIVQKSEIVGIMCLENNVVSHHFTEKRMEFMKHLASLLAVSIENATLYQDLLKYSKQLEEKNSELSRMDSLKDQFMANVSHELRTPLNGLKYKKILFLFTNKNERKTMNKRQELWV